MKRHPGMVTLDVVGCCAMTHAFLRHPDHVRQWGRASGRLHVLYEIFGTTRRMSFIPNEETAAAYRAFARAELSRLGGRDPRLLCGHGAGAHVAALERFLVELPAVRQH